MNMERKRLYKSKDDCMLFGVCGGVAEYFGVDSTIIRLFVAVFCLCLGTGLVAYLISALVIPSRPAEEPCLRTPGGVKKRRSATDKTVCGVCGGIAEYFGIDSVLVRLLLVFFCLLGGSGVIAYLIAAIIIPPAEQA